MKRAAQRLRAALLGVCCLTHVGCAPAPSMGVIAEDLFVPLSEANLSAFEQRLAHLKRAGAEGEPLTIATQWLYLLSCHPIPHLSAPERPLWRALYASLYAEESRPPEELGALAPLLKAQPEGLSLEPRALNEALWTTWPLDREGWPDEAPVYLKVPRRCQGALGRVHFDPTSGVILPPPHQKKLSTPPFKPSPEWRHLINTLSKLTLPQGTMERASLWRDLAHLGWVRAALQALSEVSLDEQVDHKVGPQEEHLLSAWRWWLSYEEALLLSRRSGVALGWPIKREHPLAGRALHEEACERWRELTQQAKPQKGSPQARTLAPTQAALMWGLCLEERGHEARALELWAGLPLQDLEGEARHLVRYHQLRLLSALGRWREALSLREHLPPEGSALYPAFCYALGQAHHNAGDEAGLMALSTDVFRERSWRADPMLRGLFYLFVRALTRFDFEARAVELLEDLGPRSETHERVRLFAEVALDEARPVQAREAVAWLLAREVRGEGRWRYHTLLAHAALLELNEPAYQAALRAVSGINEKANKALPSGRRGAFYKERDQALTQALRRLLPSIAEWPQSTTRRVWLELTLSEVQRFLRARPESRARAELNELYRAGRASLSPSSRLAYAERVGRKKPEALILGNVRVKALNLSPFEPREVALPLSPPPALTLTPSAQLNPLTWRLTWSPSERSNPFKEQSFVPHLAGSSAQLSPPLSSSPTQELR